MSELRTLHRDERTLTVCVVAPLPPPSGGIAHWSQTLQVYAQGRSDVCLVSVDTAPRWRATYDLRIWRRIAGGAVQLCRDIAKLLLVLLRTRPDVLHLTTSGQLGVIRDVAVMAAAAAARVNVVYHLHFGRVPQIAARNTMEWAGLKVALRLASAVVTLDERTQRTIAVALPLATVHTIPNCVDPAAAEATNAGSAPGVRTVVYVGWVIPSKGIGELVEAWTRIAASGWRLTIIGPGDAAYRAGLVERFRPSGVQFEGELPRDQALAAIAAADVLVLPSHTEGFPYVVLEAMMLGKAVVATSVGAVPEMLSDGCGIVVEPQDVPELSSALERVMKDEEPRLAMGARARARASSEYSIDAVFRQHMALWRQVSADRIRSVVEGAP